MIERFVGLINDDMSIDEVRRIAHNAAPNPTGFVTWAEFASDIAEGMQYAVYGDQALEEEVAELKEANASLKETIESQDDVIRCLEMRLKAAEDARAQDKEDSHRRIEDALARISKIEDQGRTG
ncbi:hypothetical protein ACFC1L_39865 [Streptomyces sp. NPDC056210]|uniref:hypothetical protein n=1 Tax=Streptomyces sp. NPDC056210 TaxID=3345746 RepID=UPI0035DAE94B